MTNRFGLVVGLLLACAGWAPGQTAPPDQSELIRQLLDRIDALEQRVRDLELQREPAAAPAGETAGEAASEPRSS